MNTSAWEALSAPPLPPVADQFSRSSQRPLKKNPCRYSAGVQLLSSSADLWCWRAYKKFDPGGIGVIRRIIELRITHDGGQVGPRRKSNGACFLRYPVSVI